MGSAASGVIERGGGGKGALGSSPVAGRCRDSLTRGGVCFVFGGAEGGGFAQGVAALARVALKKSDGCLLTFAALQLSSSADDAGADADHVTSEALFVGDRGAFKDLVASALIGRIERGLAVGR